MDIKDKIEISQLMNVYGGALTESQRNITEYYCNMDMSLGEISELLNITRQGVRDALIRAQIVLNNFESKLGIYAKLTRFSTAIDDIILSIDEEKTKLALIAFKEQYVD